MADDSQTTVTTETEDETQTPWAEGSGFAKLRKTYAPTPQMLEQKEAFKKQFWEALMPIVPLAVNLHADYAAIKLLFSGETVDATGKKVQQHALFPLIEHLQYDHPRYPGVNRDAYSWYEDHVGNLVGAEQLIELQHPEFAKSVKDILGYRYFYQLVESIDEFDYQPCFKEQLLDALRQSGKVSAEDIGKAEELLNRYEEDLNALKAASKTFLDAQREGIDRYDPEKVRQA